MLIQVPGCFVAYPQGCFQAFNDAVQTTCIPNLPTEMNDLFRSKLFPAAERYCRQVSAMYYKEDPYYNIFQLVRRQVRGENIEIRGSSPPPAVGLTCEEVINWAASASRAKQEERNEPPSASSFAAERSLMVGMTLMYAVTRRAPWVNPLSGMITLAISIGIFLLISLPYKTAPPLTAKGGHKPG